MSSRFETGASIDVVVSASAKAHAQWSPIVEDLKSKGLSVAAPLQTEAADWESLPYEELVGKKQEYMDRHFAHLAVARTVLVANFEKSGQPGYVGPNTLMEMAFAYSLNKPIYLLNETPVDQGSGLEVHGVRPNMLDGTTDQLVQDLKENVL